MADQQNANPGFAGRYGPPGPPQMNPQGFPPRPGVPGPPPVGQQMPGPVKSFSGPPPQQHGYPQPGGAPAHPSSHGHMGQPGPGRFPGPPGHVGPPVSGQGPPSSFQGMHSLPPRTMNSSTPPVSAVSGTLVPPVGLPRCNSAPSMPPGGAALPGLVNGVSHAPSHPPTSQVNGPPVSPPSGGMNRSVSHPMPMQLGVVGYAPPVSQPGVSLPPRPGVGMGPMPVSQSGVVRPPTSPPQFGVPPSQPGMRPPFMGTPPMGPPGVGLPPVGQAQGPPQMGPPPVSQPGVPPVGPPTSQPMGQTGPPRQPGPPFHMGGPPSFRPPGPVPMSQPGMPPMSQPGPPPMMRPGAPPISQPGVPPMSQSGPLTRPPLGVPPMSQPGPTLMGNSMAPGHPTGHGDSLPAPYQGHGQYSHQLNTHTNATPGMTPTNSEPASQRSSRDPSPVPGMQYDALEGGGHPGSYVGGGQVSPPAPQDMHQAGITGRRQYPEMNQANFAHPTVPPPGGAGPYTQLLNDAMAGQTQNPNYMANSIAHTAGNINAGMNNMKLAPAEGRMLNLLQERHIIPPEGVETAKPNLSHDFKRVNCNPDIFRCTLTSIPQSQSLLNKSRLPLGILIHPFRDLSETPEPIAQIVENQLPVIQSSVIVRCRSCRTYINPFVAFVDMRRWKCNLCFRINELPEEFNYDPVSKTYGEPQRRPEIRSATIEFIAPSEYMLRPPQPAVYLYVLDVSFNAISTGYLQTFCQTLLDELDRIPGDSRTQIGFITFDHALHFFNLAEGLSQPQMLVVSDVDDVFLPCPDSLLTNMHESKELVTDLLNQLPSMFEGNMETGSALGAALQAAYKLMGPTGGRVSVFQTQLPTVGPGALKNREDPNERAGKKVQHLGPATDFYKKLSLECSAQQIAVDIFMCNTQYADVASVGCISKYSGGSLHYFPGLHAASNPAEMERFEGTLRRYFTRKIGFESVMRIRCTRGLSIHTFHGNFFVRSTDLLSLPNINPDAGFGMQMSIEDNIDSSTASFQAALLYTSSKGERRIRVHTLCLPVTNQLAEVFAGADQRGIMGLLTKMAVDKSISTGIGDARDAMINAATDMLSAYGASLTASQRLGQLPICYSLRMVPLYILSMLKFVAFRLGASTKLDDRVNALEQCKTMPLCYLLQELYPDLYPVHALDDQGALNKADTVIPQPPVLQLSSANMDRHGVYLMDTGSRMYLWIGAAVNDHYCRDVFEQPNFQSIPEGMMDLPECDNPTSELLRNFINHLNDQRPFPASLYIMREDSRMRGFFLAHMVEDRAQDMMSYYEFLQHLQKEVKS